MGTTKVPRIYLQLFMHIINELIRMKGICLQKYEEIRYKNQIYFLYAYLPARLPYCIAV